MENINVTEKARRIRGDILRMLYTSQSGHPGGSLSCVEILISLYYQVANVDPKNPKMENRDRIVLSKGHACPALYAVLADKGYFPREDLWTLRQIDSHLQGHPDSTKTPGVDENPYPALRSTTRNFPDTPVQKEEQAV
jgi:transketolase